MDIHPEVGAWLQIVKYLGMSSKDANSVAIAFTGMPGEAEHFSFTCVLRCVAADVRITAHMPNNKAGCHRFYKILQAFS